MRVNHLIIGCEDVVKSQWFYSNILGFPLENTFIDTGTGKEGVVLVDKTVDLELLLVPFNYERLPSPQHIAFEVEDDRFHRILKNAENSKLDIRSLPPLDCEIKGVGTTIVRGKKFERFYLLDPSRVNIEIMRLC
tara:strand:- start:346 stop:750 length:405 start_codon:yes stop_codon:yes gene_type:complete